MIGEWVKSEQELAVLQTLTERLIGSFEKEDMAKLVRLVGEWRLLLGVTTDTTEQELIVITQFLYDNFKHFSLTDIRLAMNWAISGFIDVGFVSQKTISAQYISKCLNTYEQQKARIVNDAEYNRQKFLDRKEIDNPIQVSAETKMAIHKEFVVSMYDRYKETGRVDDFGGLLYKWLKVVKAIRPTQQNINEATNAAHERFVTERQSNASPFLKAAAGKANVEQTDEDLKKRYAREYLISKAFSEHELIDLVKLIKIEYFI
jgi:hypothetical protein